MFQKILLLVIISCASVLLGHEGFASVTYTPGPKISLTGTTIDVRFDVASPLFGTSFSGAYLDTTTRNMSGAFYIEDIGWALMSSGSYQVAINCGTQYLSGLTIQCQFTGSGWSENIGELGFQNVRYNPSTATLSGSITSFAGNLSVEGIYMPLIGAELNESLLWLKADHSLTYTIKNTQRYVNDNAWSFRALPSKNPTYFRITGGGADGRFAGVDLSLADMYTLQITDPDGGITEYSGVVVGPADVSTSLDSTSGIFVEVFCTANPTYCPDGSIRTATILSTTDMAPQIADGVDAYNMTLKIRDKYGNRVTSGTVEVSYTGTVSEVQLPSKIVLSPYSSLRDTLRLGGDIYAPYDASGNWKSSAITLGHTDIMYTVSSIAPTDTTNNRVVLDKIVYRDMNGTTTTITDTTPLVFGPTYTLSLTPPTDIQIGLSSTFTGVFLSHTTESLSPQIIGLFEVGNGLLAEYRNFQSTTTITQQSPDIGWMIRSFPSSMILSDPPASFAFSGIYVPRTLYPEIETVYYDALVYYNINGIDIVYPVFSGDKTAEYRDSKVKILGQNNARGEYGTIGTHANNRTGFINALRKNITLLNRGRTTYDDVDYKVITSDATITDSDFGSHQTIVAVGADITIDGNISKKDKPLAIIALADASGVGGNISIAEDVTDIHAGLFAEKSVFSSGNNQLYILGAIISANTLGDTAAGLCPYYVTGICEPEKYDLENLRGYEGIPPQTGSSRATEYPYNSLIIEYDMRLQSDPPAGLPQ